ncbi:amidohydrolase family protein [Peristeroidobacter agariperforans]|uniref:amidohydrolase family protein n=1 Tax=Peristeroidobacter agariperforans TaxID=268404 RepID=UPI00101B8CE4|nr:amidohydrolase family protein [Peristeroidobacter agariperforans]
MHRGRAVLLILLCALGQIAAGATQPAHYDVHARFNAANGDFAAEVTVTLPLEELADPAFLLGGQITIDAFEVSGGGSTRIESVDKPLRGLQLLTLQFAKPPKRPVKLRLRYHGSVNAERDQPGFTPSGVELRLEHFWLPVRRDLGLFFSARARLEGMPEGMTFVAQGNYRQRGTTLTIDRSTPDNDLPIAGMRGMIKQVSDDVEFFSAAPDDPLVAHIYKHAHGSAGFLRSKFGPLPEPLRVVVMPRTTGSAYARRHWISLPSFLIGEPTPPFDPLNVARTVAHESYHAWLPSPEGGGENHWIAESLAEYSALRYLQTAFGEPPMRALLARKVIPALDAGSLLTADRPSRASLYQKGPLLLFKLEDRIGRDALDSIVYRPDRPRSTAAFMTLLRAAAGETVANEFQQQLIQPGLPADLVSAARYSVVMSNAVKGELTVLPAAGRERRTTLQFNDRGRGPELNIVSRYDERGMLISHQLHGLNYAKRPIEETFASTGGKARWRSHADHGDTEANGYYLPNEANAEDLAALARALLRAQGELALLPAGKARIEKAQRLSVHGANGAMNVTLYLLSGIQLQPQPLWLDADLELFASAATWQSVVRTGFEESLPALIAAQDQTLSMARIARGKALRRQPQRPLLIRDARMFDAERRVMKPGMSVLVKGDRIVAVAPTQDLVPSGDVEVIDARGRTLLPGLWEMHAHVLSESEGALSLMAGVTSDRDLGNNPQALARLTQLFDEGSLPGPWITAAELIDGRDPMAAPIGTLVGTPEEMRDAVNAAADRGYPQVKFYSSLSRELLDVGIATARKRNLRISGHVPAGMTLREAILAGYQEVNHANFWILNFMPPEVVKVTNTPVRFSAVLEHGHELDLDSKQVRELIALMKRRNVVVDPTLVTFENMFTGYKGEMSPWMAPWANRLPAAVVRGGRSGGRASTPEQRATYTQSFTRMKQMLKLLHEAGVPIVAGTDSDALLYARELELYVEAGIPAAEVLYIATLGAARVMGQDHEAGSIAPGKRADLILVDGDPLANVGDVRRTRMVIKGGAMYDCDALAAAAGLSDEPAK